MNKQDEQMFKLITALDEIRCYGVTGEDAKEMIKIADDALKSFEAYVGNIGDQLTK